MSKLKPGPELDALVAEKVMRWTPVEHPDKLAGQTGAFYPIKFGGGIYREPGGPWSPSTDIRDAWEVVEKMLSEGRSITLQALEEGDPERWWDVSVDEAVAEKISAPHAICLAALKAVGEP